MLYLLSKIVYWLIMPVSLIAWMMIGSFIVSRRAAKQKLRSVGIALFLFFTNPLISTLAINAWEPDPQSYQNIQEKFEYGIVLSGITNPDRPPFDRTHFNKGADRIIHAIDLYQRGIIKKILITGGSGTITYEGKKESTALKEFALSYNIPAADILVEDQARNTRENALYCSQLITSNKSSILLITSAFHMPRAKRCFTKVGLTPTTFPTDYYGTPLHFTPDEIIIPSVQSLIIWSILIKEYVGLASYWIVGYI